MVFLVCFIDFWCRRTLYWFANTAEEKALSIGEDDGSGPFIWQPEMTGRSAHLGGPLFSFPVVFNLLWFYYIPLFLCVCCFCETRCDRISYRSIAVGRTQLSGIYWLTLELFFFGHWSSRIRLVRPILLCDRWCIYNPDAIQLKMSIRAAVFTSQGPAKFKFMRRNNWFINYWVPMVIYLKRL